MKDDPDHIPVWLERRLGTDAGLLKIQDAARELLKAAKIENAASRIIFTPN